jgi:hypothetical protein
MDLGDPLFKRTPYEIPQPAHGSIPRAIHCGPEKRVRLRADPPALAGFSVAFAPKQLRGMEQLPVKSKESLPVGPRGFTPTGGL